MAARPWPSLAVPHAWMMVVVVLLLLLTQLGITSPAAGAAAATSAVAVPFHRASRSLAATNTGFRSLVTAVSKANALKRTVTVVLTQNVVLQSPLPVLKGRAGVIVRGQCKNARGRPTKCVIDGAGKHHMFPGSGYTGSCSITLENLTIQNVFNGVHFGGCKFTATNVLFQNNRKNVGGGAVLSAGMLYPYVAGSPNVFKDCTFTNNEAITFSGMGGGAIASGHNGKGARAPALEIIRCTFRNNRAPGERGGAIYFEGANSLKISASTFISNLAGEVGGAVMFSGTSLVVRGSTFSSNTAKGGYGGAFFLDSFTAHNVRLPAPIANTYFCSSTFTRNIAKSGRDIYLGDAKNFAFGSVNFCGMRKPSGVFQATPYRRNYTWWYGTNCRGIC